jgi:hypothetical protein
MKKQFMIGAAASALCVISLVGVTSATSGTKPASLASELAAKFNLKQADVQAVLDAHKGEKHMYREQKVKEHIAQAVKDGKITQAQADALIAKLAELHPVKPATGKPTEAEHKAMKVKMTAFHQWLEDNDIPKDLIGHGIRGHHGPGGPGMHGDKPAEQ